MNHPKLNIGILLNNLMIENWAYESLFELNASYHSKVNLVVIDNNTHRKKNGFLFNLYSKYDAWRVGISKNAQERRSANDILNCDHISYDEVNNKLGSYSIDLFIDLRDNSSTKNISSFSKFGTLKLHQGVHQDHYPKVPGVWELFDDWDATGVVLELQKPNKDQGVNLDHLYLNKDKTSITRNQNNLYWKSKGLLLKNLERIQNLGTEKFNEIVNNKVPLSNSYHSKYQKAPNGLSTISSSLKLQWRGLKAKLSRSFYFDQWVLLFSLNNHGKYDYNFSDFSRILPPKDRFWADPFVIQKDGKYFIFIEEFLFSERKGKISVMEMDSDGKYKQPRVVLEKDYHLSYPFLIEDNGQIYMLPETSGNNTIELYKCIDFPYKWDLVEVLIDDIKTVDSTIHKYQNKYWLFTNVEAIGTTETVNELHMYSSDTLLNGNWTSHPKNPLTSNHSFSRPAGAIYQEQDRLVRPAQNCSKQYGFGMNIQEIITLTEKEYRELTINTILPNWGKNLLATHTINHAGSLTVIDAMIKRKK